MNTSDSTPNRRILVIDDNPAIHEDFRKILAAPAASDEFDAISKELFGESTGTTAHSGFELESAFQGEEGLERVKQAVAAARPYAMAFIDVRMPPGWDGVETTAKLWETYPDLQVVICTAYSDYAWEDMIAKVGQSDRLLILKKPFDNVEVLQLANALTEKWRLLQYAKLKIDGLEQAVAARTQQLRRSEERFKKLCNFSPFGIFETDPMGRCSYTNPRWNEISGRSFEDNAGLGWSQAIHPEDREAAMAAWKTAADAGHEWSNEIRLLNASGELRWGLMVTSPMFSPNGELLGYVGTVEDITERKRAEARIESFSKLGHQLSATKTAKAAADIIVEIADQLLRWDACLLDLYSASDDIISHIFYADLVNGKRTACIPECDHRPPSDLARTAIKQGGQLVLKSDPRRMQPGTVPFGDASRPSASIVIVPIRNNAKVIGILSIHSYRPGAYDQSSLETLQALADHCGAALDRINTEETLHATQEQLRQSQKLEAIGQLAGGIAHDFNNLLTVIRGNTELVLMNPAQLQPMATDCLTQAVSAADRAAKLTCQLLAFSRKQVMQARPLNLSEVVHNLSKMLRRIIGEHIELRCDCEPNLPLVQADVGMLEQVLVNLAVNSRDAMPRGGDLVIATAAVELDAIHARDHEEARPGRFVTLSVVDSGTGIEEEHLPRIFEPFFTTKDVGKGTGLGLATVYGIVKQHRGWIEVSTRLGIGSTFRLFLPALEVLASVPAFPEGLARPHGGKEKILLVEDEDSVRLMTRRLLEQFGYTVYEAGSGRAALEVCRSHSVQPDLLLTDIVMPEGMTGREVAEQLRVDNPGLKVVFTSGYSGDTLGHDTEFARQSHSRFLAKPCAPNELLKTIRDYLDTSA